MGHNIQQHDLGVCKDDTWHHHSNYRITGADLTLEDIDSVFHFDFTARPVFIVLDDGTQVEVPNRRAIVRDDVNLPLSVMGDRFSINQYRSYYRSAAEIMLSQEVPIHTAGTIGNGAKAFMSVAMPDDLDIQIGTDDVVKQYVHFADSVDGSSATKATQGAFRIQCENTWNAALVGVKPFYSIKHTAGAEALVDETIRNLEDALARAVAVRTAVERLVNEVLTEADFVGLLKHNKMLGDCPEKDGKGRTQWQNRYAGIMAAYHKTDLDQIRETQFGAIQAVQNWWQHDRTIRKGASAEGRHLDELVFSGEKMPETIADLLGVWDLNADLVTA
jgi:phage/plasmid-like protein (TIGR03299 family)